MGEHGNRPRLSRVVWMMLAFAALLADCTGGSVLPDFPVFPPTVPFLEEQEERKRRARAIAEFNRREQLKYGFKNQEENLAAWLPIYNRVEHARRAKPLRDRARHEAFVRFQEQTKARWLPVQTRILISRETRPRQEAMERELMSQRQEKTKSEWLPHQTRVFEHRETRDERELQAFIKTRREARFPRGTRLPGIGGTPRRTP